jgi:phosphoenolpyruvate---glycerone phosphotransferase subunit DhaL
MAAALVRAGIKGIERAGEAGQGDRTMLDALVPLLEALQSAAQRGEPPVAAAAAAAAAARNGAESTKLMAAKVGRAGWIPDRAKGNVDAGAHAVAVVAAAVARAIS